MGRGHFSGSEIGAFEFLNQRKRILWHLLKRPFYLRLPNYVPWKEEELLKTLKEELSWDGTLWEQHKDCTMSDVKEYLKIKKFGVTELCVKLSTLIRDEQMSRESASLLIKDYESGVMQQEQSIRGQMREAFDLSEEQLEQAIRASTLPFVPKTESIMNAIARSRT